MTGVVLTGAGAGAGMEGTGSACLDAGGVCVAGGASLPLLDPDFTSYKKNSTIIRVTKKL